MDRYDCDLILDIMPLVRDGAASKTTQGILAEHIACCESCRKLYASLPKTDPQPEGEAVKTLEKIRRRMTLSGWSILAITALVGSFLTMTEHMGYNVVLFPIVGVIAFLLMGKSAWRGIPAVASISFLWLLARLFTLWMPPDWAEIGDCLLFSLFYGAAYGAGFGLTWLLRSALGAPREAGVWGQLKHFCSFLPALLILGGLLWACDSFLGNPISAAAVKAHSRAYIQEEYPDLELELGEIEFDWYSGPAYWIEVTSPGSQDIFFSMKYDRLGRFLGDSYDEYVTSGINTFSRLTQECDRETERLRCALEEKGCQVSLRINSDWPSIYDGVIEYPFGPEKELTIRSLCADEDYSAFDMIQTYGVLDVSLRVENPTKEKLKEVLLEIRESYSGLPDPRPACVDVQLYSDGGSITIKGFPYDQIGERTMDELLQYAIDAWLAFETEYQQALAQQ